MQNTPPLANLHPDFLPHRQWPFRRWYYAVGMAPVWYYHAAMNATEAGELARRQLKHPPVYDFVDPLLRPLCRFVHEQGLATTPSCEGHFHPRDYFLGVFQKLRQQAALIRSTGLPMQDSATGDAVVFQNPRYVFPWPSYPIFLAQAYPQQFVGYLGILLPAGHPLLQGLEEQPYESSTAMLTLRPATPILANFVLCDVVVQARNPPEQALQWRLVTAHFQSLLQTAGRT